MPTFVEVSPADNEGALARLVTWNILADGPGLALSNKHDYCPLDLREWPGRVQRIITTLRSFNADLVCLQECSYVACATHACVWLPRSMCAACAQHVLSAAQHTAQHVRSLCVACASHAHSYTMCHV